MDSTRLKDRLQDRLTRSVKRLTSRGKWRQSRDKKPKIANGLATVSQATRDRLIQEALASPAYEGMSLDEVSAFVNSKLNAYISPRSPYPYWYGRLPQDKAPRPMTEAQLNALARARERKAEIQAQADAPYVREDADPRSSQAESLAGDMASEEPREA